MPKSVPRNNRTSSINRIAKRVLKTFGEDQDIMVAALPFTAIQNSLHTCATVKQSCSSLDLDSCLPFRVYTFQLISLTVWYSAGKNYGNNTQPKVKTSTYSSNRLKWLCAVLVKYSSVLHYAKGIKYVPP